MILMNLFSNGVKKRQIKKAIIPALIYYVYLFACMMLIDITTEYRFKEFSYSFFNFSTIVYYIIRYKRKRRMYRIS